MDNLIIPQKEIDSLCRKYNFKELSIFGLFLRDDFNEKSDIDLLYTFHDNNKYGLFDIIRIKKELENIFGRNVDFVSRKAVERSRNIYRKKAILKNTKVIYTA